MALNFNPPTATGALVALADIVSAFKFAQINPVALVSAGTTEVLSGAQLASGMFVRSGGASAVTATTDTAANIIAALGPNVSTNQTFKLLYVNLNNTSGTVTVTAGTGVTLVGTMPIPINGLRVFIGTVTGVGATPSISLNGVFSIGSGLAA